MYLIIWTGCDSEALLQADRGTHGKFTQISPALIKIEPSTGEIVLYSQESIFR
jgi:hypothetical protein